jgi:hypothetical protein
VAGESGDGDDGRKSKGGGVVVNYQKGIVRNDVIRRVFFRWRDGAGMG